MKRKLSLLTLLVALVGIPLGLYAVASGTIVADGNTDIDWKRGSRGTISFSGDFDSGTITIFYLVGDTYVSFKDSADADISYTDDNGMEFVCWSKSIRVTMAGTGTADVDYHIGRVN